MRIKDHFKLSLLTSAVLLAGCGGGSSNSENATPEVEAINPVPVVSITDIIVDEKSSVSVSADIDTKTDTVASYQWQVTSDTSIELSGDDTATLSFTAPEVNEDTPIELSLTVTDSSGDATTASGTISVSQITIPLSISGLATDAPIANAQISVRIAGRDITVDVVADSSGAYTVDLLLDDTEEDAFISIEARGIGEQSSAGLISLLGTAGQLSAQAGDDNELTADESFAVNVTNVTTAEYALATLANDGNEFTNDEQLANITESLNYDEVMTLATAIKVAIDKVSDNASLTLPTEIPTTLDLVEAIIENTDESEIASSYVQTIQSEPEFEEAENEILEDENLVDIASEYIIPSAYYLLAPGSLYTGEIYYFAENGTGSSQFSNSFNWQESGGIITLSNFSNTDIETFTSWVDTNNDGYTDIEVDTQTLVTQVEIQKLSSTNTSDAVVVSTTSTTHYPNNEVEDVISEPDSITHRAIKPQGVKTIAPFSAAVAYLPIEQQDMGDGTLVSADAFILNADGTGELSILGDSFQWTNNNGELEIRFADESETAVTHFKKLTNNIALDQYSKEFSEEGETEGHTVGWGKIAEQYPQWQLAEVPGIYSYENLSFDDPNEHFWFELHENGDAETYSTRDDNEDGELTYDEAQTMYGKWQINEDGTLTVTRVRELIDFDGVQNFGGYDENCRDDATEGCALYHERIWRLAGINDNEFGIFHQHYFHFSTSPDWQLDDQIYYDNRTLFKIDESPIDISSLPYAAQKPSRSAKGKTGTKTIIRSSNEEVADKYKQLEPSRG